MFSIKKHIPNGITCLNLFSGCVGIVFAFQHNLLFAAYALFAAALFDFFDGFAARLLKAYTEIGKELDSLADMVSFGLLPGVIVYQLFLQAPQIEGVSRYLNYIAFLIPVFSAIRLANFNLDTLQAKIFIGLPTPANGILISSFPFILHQHNNFYSAFILNPFFLACFVLIMGSLLVAEIPLMSLKFKGMSFKVNIYRYLLLAIAAFTLVFFKFVAIPVVIFVYIAISVLQFKFTK